MIKRKVFFPVLTLAIIGAGLVKANFVSAQDMTGPNSLITAIAQKFNLNETDVKEVFEEEKSKRESERKVQLEQKLTQATADGKITEVQKQAIITKFSEMKSGKPNPEDFNSMTEEQRKAHMETKKTEMENWAKENGLDLQTLKSLVGHGKGFGKMGQM